MGLSWCGNDYNKRLVATCTVSEKIGSVHKMFAAKIN